MEEYKVGPQPLQREELQRRQEANKDTFRVVIPKQKLLLKTRGGNKRKLKIKLTFFKNIIKRHISEKITYNQWYFAEYLYVSEIVDLIKSELNRGNIGQRIWDAINQAEETIEKNKALVKAAKQQAQLEAEKRTQENTNIQQSWD